MSLGKHLIITRDGKTFCAWCTLPVGGLDEDAIRTHLRERHGIKDVNESTGDTAWRLVLEGWKSTSTRYRHLVRLPEGLTGREALRRVRRRKLPDHITEEHAEGQWMRVYAPEQYRITVSQEVYALFRAYGGETAR